MQSMSPDYETLPRINRVEILRFALASHPGDDLAKVPRLRLEGWLSWINLPFYYFYFINQMVWLQSGNSETWILRRRNFTRSLAVMVRHFVQCLRMACF